MDHAKHCLEKCVAPMSGQQNGVRSEAVEAGGQSGVGGRHDGMWSRRGDGGGTRFNSGKTGKSAMACGQASIETTEDRVMKIGQLNAGESEQAGQEHGQRSASSGEQAMDSEHYGTGNERLGGEGRQGVIGGKESGMEATQHVAACERSAEQADATTARDSATHADSPSAWINPAQAKDEPGPAKVRKVKIRVPADGQRWLKYGEKTQVSNNLVRAYFRCALWNVTGCRARLLGDFTQASRMTGDGEFSYVDEHNHCNQDPRVQRKSRLKDCLASKKGPKIRKSGSSEPEASVNSQQSFPEHRNALSQAGAVTNPVDTSNLGSEGDGEGLPEAQAPNAQPGQQHGDALAGDGDEPRGRDSIEGLTSDVPSVHAPEAGALGLQGPRLEGENESSAASAVATVGTRAGTLGGVQAMYDALNGVVVFVIEKQVDAKALERQQGKEERQASEPAPGAAEPGEETDGVEMLGEPKRITHQAGGSKPEDSGSPTSSRETLQARAATCMPQQQHLAELGGEQPMLCDSPHPEPESVTALRCYAFPAAGAAAQTASCAASLALALGATSWEGEAMRSKGDGAREAQIQKCLRELEELTAYLQNDERLQTRLVVDSLAPACHTDSSLQSRMASNHSFVTAFLRNLLSQQELNRKLLRPDNPSPLPKKPAPQPSEGAVNRLSKNGQRRLTFCPGDCSPLASCPHSARSGSRVGAPPKGSSLAHIHKGAEASCAAGVDRPAVQMLHLPVSCGTAWSPRRADQNGRQHEAADAFMMHGLTAPNQGQEQHDGRRLCGSPAFWRNTGKESQGQQENGAWAMEAVCGDKEGQHQLGPWNDVLISAAPLGLVDSPRGHQSARSNVDGRAESAMQRTMPPPQRTPSIAHERPIHTRMAPEETPSIFDEVPHSHSLVYVGTGSERHLQGSFGDLLIDAMQDIM